MSGNFDNKNPKNEMLHGLLKIVMGDLSWLGENKSTDIKEMLLRYFLLLVRFLVAFSIVALIFVGITTLQWINPPSWLAIDLKLDGQTLANYVGIVLGSAVAFAGSVVAIVIAQIAMKAQLEANKLADPFLERANEVTLARNRLNSAHLLLKTANETVRRSEHATNRQGDWTHFIDVANLLMPMISKSILETDFVTVCIKNCEETQSCKDNEILNSVNQIIKQLEDWKQLKDRKIADNASHKQFVNDRDRFFSHMATLCKAIEVVDRDWIVKVLNT